MPLGEKHAPPSHRLHLATPLGPDGVVAAAVAEGPAILQVHVPRIAEGGSGIPLVVEHAEPLEESLHPRLAAAAEPAAKPHVVLEAGREVPEHGIDFRRQGHEVRRPGGQHLIQAPVEVVERDVHVERGADVQADAETVQLPHHEVFEAAADELLAGAKDLGPDEAGHVVEMHPRLDPTGPRHPAGEQPGKAILSRLVHHHVDALGVAVGEVGPLAGFEVQSPRSAAGVGVAEHLFERDIERGIGRIPPGDALKPDAGAARGRGIHLGLHVDVGQHAVGHGVLEPKGFEHASERIGDGPDARRLARDRIGAKHHVADAVLILEDQ